MRRETETGERGEPGLVCVWLLPQATPAIAYTDLLEAFDREGVCDRLDGAQAFSFLLVFVKEEIGLAEPPDIRAGHSIPQGKVIIPAGETPAKGGKRRLPSCKPGHDSSIEIRNGKFLGLAETYRIDLDRWKSWISGRGPDNRPGPSAPTNGSPTTR